VACQHAAATALMLIISPPWLIMWQHEQAYPKKMGQLSNLLAHTHSITCGGALLCQKYVFHSVTVIDVTLISAKNLQAEFGCHYDSWFCCMYHCCHSYCVALNLLVNCLTAEYL
jgi:hypothetical protein